MIDADINTETDSEIAKALAELAKHPGVLTSILPQIVSFIDAAEEIIVFGLLSNSAEWAEAQRRLDLLGDILHVKARSFE